jgi:O-antigen/teichoic acid export membrane protein
MIELIKSKLYKNGFFHLLSTNVLIQMLGFGSTLAVAKLLSPEELGSVKLLQSYSGIFAVFAGFGLSTALLKYCSENRSEEEKEAIFGATMARAAMATFATLVCGAALCFSGVLTTSGHGGCGSWSTP